MCESGCMHHSPVDRPWIRSKRGIHKAGLAAVLVFAGLSVSPARALELHSFVDDHCQVKTGVLVRVDEMSVHFITLEGTYATLPVESVGVVVIHKVLTSLPFKYPRQRLPRPNPAWPTRSGGGQLVHRASIRHARRSRARSDQHVRQRRPVRQLQVLGTRTACVEFCVEFC
jgi:hypothetical protein